MAAWIRGRVGIYGEGIYQFNTSNKNVDGDTVSYNVALGYRLAPAVYETYPSPQLNAYLELNGAATRRSSRAGRTIEDSGQGLRKSGSQGFASQIWGVERNEYLRRADPWPINPEGELLLGVKIEDSYALEKAEETTCVPGIALAEWGPGDMGFWLVGIPRPGVSSQQQPQMVAARERVFQATRDAGIFFLNTCNNDNVTEMIDEGVMICTGGYEVGR